MLRIVIAITVAALALSACDWFDPARIKDRAVRQAIPDPYRVADADVSRYKDQTLPFAMRLSSAALARTRASVIYDPAYVRISYPGGDVAPGRGVCTDEVVRAYRLLGIDLQQLVHEDMRRAFSVYPRRWGLSRPDPNIDHRRVPNLEVFFTRHGTTLPVTQNGRDYQAGELVTWMLPGNLPHIGLVTAKRTRDGARPLIVHNIGAGPQLEDMLFNYNITGRFRYGSGGSMGDH